MIHAKRRKSAQRKDKRHDILRAAVSEFAKKGYNNANINEIAALAEVATGTIYNYFLNKDDLLIQAMHAMVEDTLRSIKKRIAGEPRAVDKLIRFFYEHVSVFTANPVIARFMVVELRQSEEFYKRYPTYNPYNEYLHYIQELCRQSIAEETTLPYDPVTLSYLIIGFMDMTLTQWVINPDNVNLQSICEEAQQILHFGLATDSYR